MAFNSDNSAQMPSGGVRALVPDLEGVAPSKVRARVRAERDADLLGPRDGQGRPQAAYPTGDGNHENVVTLPRFASIDRMTLKNAHEPCKAVKTKGTYDE